MAIDAKNLDIRNLCSKFWMLRVGFLVVAMKMFMGTTAFASMNFFQSIVNCFASCMGSFRRAAIPFGMIFSSKWSADSAAFNRAISSGATISLSFLEWLSTIKAYIIHKNRWFFWFSNSGTLLGTADRYATSMGIITKELDIARRTGKLRFAGSENGSWFIRTAHYIQCAR